MGFFDSLFAGKRSAPASSVTFHLDSAAHTYEDGAVGLEATTLDITPECRRVAVIGLNGAGKTTLLKLLDGALTATSGTVRIEADGVSYDPSVKRDLKHVEDMVGRVRREELPNTYYQAASIREAVELPLKKHKMPESERQAIIGNLFAHFDLAAVSREPASALDGEKRHLLAIAAALSFSPAVLVADEPTKGLDEVSSTRVAKALFSYDKQVVFATHDTNLIVRPEYAIDRTLVVDDHKVVFDGTPRDAVDCYTDLVRSKYEALKA
ncbi:energy-coupling factor ABC transporter ATP-binding protein [Bifidobacterium ruminantium]|uniref:ABC transporter, ATP-binding protein n=1 Tax=Bifidobacterium ruminantium TaxID=78346 RepID=A0A087D499_BIFRU|nr:energy-coupling factor ABC transporter ATP-binding protein [Bifidobacterium ruminantium]KFI90349.1 ABC transporter, ATP-binding protein [Bifidobacterium ruminantium]